MKHIRWFAVWVVIMMVYSVPCVASADTKDNYMHDEMIISVLEQLNVPFTRPLISSSISAPYQIVKDSGLRMVESYPVGHERIVWYTGNEPDFIDILNNQGTIELYAGRKQDYLAILRFEQSIYCAQYINDYSSTDVELNDKEYDVIESKYDFLYCHEHVLWISGPYMKGRYMFFIDGPVLHITYDSPVAKQPISVGLNYFYDYCLLPDSIQQETKSP